MDLTPVREQGRLNTFMSFGKAIGWATTAAVSGVLLTAWGLGATAVLATSVSTAGLLVMLFVLERNGERALPWTSGAAATVHRAGTSFRDVFKAVNKVLWVRGSLIVMAIMFFDGLIYGYGQALMPIAAVNLFGHTTAQWSQLVAMMGLIGALGLGPLIDRAGSKRMLILAVTLVGIHALTLAQTQQLWQDTTYVRVMLSIYVIMLPIVMVATIALAEAGSFWSGAMRCPKCRADMELVEYEGTQIDARQPHIWLETCSSCNGSFLDAGELRDLSTVSIADFFKDLVAPERK